MGVAPEIEGVALVIEYVASVMGLGQQSPEESDTELVCLLRRKCHVGAQEPQWKFWRTVPERKRLRQAQIWVHVACALVR